MENQVWNKESKYLTFFTIFRHTLLENVKNVIWKDAYDHFISNIFAYNSQNIKAVEWSCSSELRVEILPKIG